MKVGRFGLGFKSVFHMTGMLGFSYRCMHSLKQEIGAKSLEK